MGIEPTTPCLQSRCSSQLSYVPEGMFDVRGAVADAYVTWPARPLERSDGERSGRCERPTS